MDLVTTDWLENNLNNVKIFDASWHMPSTNRNAKKEYNERHIKGAFFWNIDEHSDKSSPYPHMMANSNYWNKMIMSYGIKNEDHVIVYDFSDLYSSCRLWFALKYFGHEKVSVLNGGMKKWLKEKKETSDKIEKIEKVDNYKIKENADWIKAKSDVDLNIENNYFQMVDARSRERFEGKVDEPRSDLKKGCIIGSKNIPYKKCINPETNTFKTKPELIEIFNQNKVDTSKPIVFTCGSGVTACVLGMAYSLISGKNAVIYDGSWSEYGKK
tara:strand:- start:10 stop:819 length:810 start_codon:yes stop_codon:yes gene_type:complete